MKKNQKIKPKQMPSRSPENAGNPRKVVGSTNAFQGVKPIVVVYSGHWFHPNASAFAGFPGIFRFTASPIFLFGLACALC